MNAQTTPQIHITAKLIIQLADIDLETILKTTNPTINTTIAISNRQLILNLKIL